MRRTTFAPTIFGASLAALTLSACGMMGGGSTPKAGEYESQATMIEFALPGMPPIPKDKLNKPTPAGKSCLTQADIEKGEWKKAAKTIKQGLTTGADCKTIRDNNSATAIDTEMQCSTPAGDKFTLIINGETQSESLSMKMAMSGKSAKGEDLKMVTEFTSKRIGDCSPEAEPAAKAAAETGATAGAPIDPNAAPPEK